MKKRIVSLILCLAVLVSAVTFAASAGSYADANKIKEMWISDVRLPYAEYYPDYDFRISSTAYTFDPNRTSDPNVINGCWWYDETDKVVLSPQTAFIKGHTYSLCIFLETNDGYEFQTDNFGTPFVKAYINGNEAKVNDDLTSRFNASIKYTFAPSDYNMEVEFTHLTVNEPVVGERPVFSALSDRQSVKITNETAGFHIEGVSWYDYTTHTYLNASDTFEENGVYEVNVLIETTGDFYFSTNGNQSDVKVTINGKTAEANYAGKDINHYLRVSYIFGEKVEEISKVEIRNLTPPTVGAKPDFELTPFVDYAYYINAVYWTDVTPSSRPSTMKETDTFQAGHIYTLEVWLRTKDGYKFRLNDHDEINIVASIGGDDAVVELPGAENAAIISTLYIMPESRVIYEAEVINVDTPYAGRTPDYDAFCTTRGCTVSSVKWYDVTDGGNTLLAEDDTFEEGRIYRVNVMLETEGDYTFLMVDRYNEATGYINGKKAIAGAADEDNWLQLGYIFAPVEEDTSRVISEFEVFDIEEPEAGNLPDTDAFTTTPGCEVTQVIWYDFTDGTFVPLAEDTPFEAGKIYRVVVEVEAGAGYSFLMIDGYNEAEGYIDGKAAESYGSHDDFLLSIGLEFELYSSDTEPSSPEYTDPTDPEGTAPSEPTEPSEPEGTKPTGPSDPADTKPTETNPQMPEVIGILGDADENGKVNVKDATAIQKHIANLITLTETGEKLADADENTKVNIKDATTIQKFVAGLPVGNKIGEKI